MTIRETVVQALGSHCRTCGTSDVRVLGVCHQSGSMTNARRHKNREAFFLGILREVKSGEWYLLCKNCLFLEAAERKLKAKTLMQPIELPSTPKAIFVWKTGIDAKTVIGPRFAWIDKYHQAGHRTFIVPRDGMVYTYPYAGEPPVLSVEEWAEGGPMPTPVLREGSNWVEIPE